MHTKLLFSTDNLEIPVLSKLHTPAGNNLKKIYDIVSGNLPATVAPSTQGEAEAYNRKPQQKLMDLKIIF